MRLKIVQSGEEVLRQIARSLTIEEIQLPDFQKLVESMRETMRDAPGVGLAAPQVGLPIQLVVIEDRPEYSKDIPPERLAERERQPVPFHVLVNPRIVDHSERQVEYFEGCLSVTGFSGLVKRSHSVIVECWDENGEPRRIEAQGWYARILQHEIDHLNGSLYIDRMEPRSFTTLDNMNRHWKEVPVQAVRDALRIK
jgi:peptide deformylase